MRLACVAFLVVAVSCTHDYSLLRGGDGDAGIDAASGSGGLPGSGGGMGGTAGVSTGSGGKGGTAGVSTGSGGKGGTAGVSTGSGGSAGSGAGSGGVQGSGGRLGSGGGQGSGGRLGSGGTGSGGAPGSGGAVGSGGTGCAEPNKTLSASATGTHCGYAYQFWSESSGSSMVLKPDGFSMTWNNTTSAFAHKGMRPGDPTMAITYDATTFVPGANAFLGAYGWTSNPLVEYYVVDSWGSWRPPGQGLVGTMISDGGDYDVYKVLRTNQPSPEGTKTFYQFWSVRSQKRTSGTITIANHFAAWAAQGAVMGTSYEMMMSVEVYQSSGTADVKMTMK